MSHDQGGQTVYAAHDKALAVSSDGGLGWRPAGDREHGHGMVDGGVVYALAADAVVAILRP